MYTFAHLSFRVRYIIEFKYDKILIFRKRKFVRHYFDNFNDKFKSKNLFEKIIVDILMFFFVRVSFFLKILNNNIFLVYQFVNVKKKRFFSNNEYIFFVIQLVFLRFNRNIRFIKILFIANKNKN